MPVPLDKKFSVDTNGRDSSQNMPALHPMWKQDIQFVEYHPPPLTEDRAARDEWFERMSYMENDLHWLLKQPHDKFWCQVVFDETLHNCIDSYLKSAPRSHEIAVELPHGIGQTQEKIHRIVFMVCIRMATHKESKENYITPNVFGDILYENFIFDIPKLMDICVLYGAGNGQLLTKMISNIFKNQPNYWEDLETVVTTVLKVFSDILEKCGCSDSKPSSPQKLEGHSAKRTSPLTMPLSELQDVLLYLFDTSNTLYRFLDVFPESSKSFAKHEIPYRIGTAYELLGVFFNEAFKDREWKDQELKNVLKLKFRKTQIGLLKSFRHITFNSYLQPLLENPTSEEISKDIEAYLTLLSSLLTERRFIAHHEHLSSFSEDYDLMTQISSTIDETRLQFIKDGIHQAVVLHDVTKKEHVQPAQNPLTGQYTVEDMAVTCTFNPDSAGLTAPGAGACAGPKVSSVQMESMISSVKDLLPDLGEGFIEVCLEEYNYKIEDVINAVLEDKLLECLQDLDRTMPREPKLEELHEEENILDKRSNVYDHDEFDVFHKDNIDTSRIHIGKREKKSDVKTVLDAREDTDNVRELYQRYGSEDVESMYDPKLGLYNEEYEDEYDDTYDTNLVGATDADSADELSVRRPFVVPRVLGNDTTPDRRGVYDTSGSEEDSVDETRKRDQFVQDPALLRQKQAERRASQEARNKKKHPAGQGPKNYDVQGGAKGQGQSSDVLRNRAWKEKNKSSRVHHNRKALSDKKRKF